jgi:hypothetical protein
MSKTSYLLKSAAVLFSVALVSAYIYDRSRSDLVPYDGGAPVASKQLLSGPKAGWVRVDPQPRRETEWKTGLTKKQAGDKSAVLIPSTKSAVIFSINQIPAGGAETAGR